MFQVTQSLTRNGKSILLTMVLALILIYLFSLLGFICFRDDFLSTIQPRKYSMPHHRHRPANPDLRTMMTTRTSSRCNCRYLVEFISVDRSNRYWSLTFILHSRLASTIPTLIERQFCTKDNCTNETITGHLRYTTTPASPVSPEDNGDPEVERACDTLFMCIVTTLNKGLRNGGGIGDVLRQPSSQVRVHECFSSNTRTWPMLF